MNLKSFSEGISTGNKEPLPEKTPSLKSFSETIDSYAWGRTGKQLREIRATFNVDEPRARALLQIAKNKPSRLTEKELIFFTKLLGKKSDAAKYLKSIVSRKKQVKRLFDLAFAPEDILTLMLQEKDKWTKAEVKKYLIELGMDKKEIPFEEKDCGLKTI